MLLLVVVEFILIVIFTGVGLFCSKIWLLGIVCACAYAFVRCDVDVWLFAGSALFWVSVYG